MNDFSFVILSFLMGIVVSGAMVNLPSSPYTKYHDAIKECEKALPRDKHCKIIEVVDDGK